jgi:hypothetical protein
MRPSNRLLSTAQLARMVDLYDSVVEIGKVFVAGLAIGAIWFLCVYVRS